MWFHKFRAKSRLPCSRFWTNGVINHMQGLPILRPTRCRYWTNAPLIDICKTKPRFNKKFVTPDHSWAFKTINVKAEHFSAHVKFWAWHRYDDFQAADYSAINPTLLVKMLDQTSRALGNHLSICATLKCSNRSTSPLTLTGCA